MRSHVIYKYQSSAVDSAVTPRSRLKRADVVSIVDSPEFTRVVGLDPREVRREGLALARGLGSAVLLQAGVALLGYTVWLLWRFVH